jgi:NAD-dependent dihydropyrimidine dehydrogenase PreA subunit
MPMYVDPAACNGCGACLDVCPHDAIQLVSGKAVMDQKKCDACAICIKACPIHAIMEEAPLVSIAQPVEPVAKPSSVIVPAPKPVRSPSPWLGTMLKFVGREILPRLLDVLEQRLLSPAQSPAGIRSTQREANPPLQRATHQTSGAQGRGPKRLRRRYHSDYSNSYHERR